MRTRMSGMSSDVENRADGEGSPFLESRASGDAEYDNSKNLRHGESLLDMAKTPSEIVQSLRDVSWALVRDLLISFACFYFGVHGPKQYILPMIGGLTMRPIPYQTTKAGDILLDLTLSNEFIEKNHVTFTSERLWFVGLWLPIILACAIGAVLPLSTMQNNSPIHNIHAGLCLVLTGIGICESITQTFKFYVGRLRPNFYDMCGFDKLTLSCTRGPEWEMEARMSFPSGHSSLSFCGMTALALFFVGRLGLWKNTASTWRGKIMVLSAASPLLLSFWCATSRLVDNWHHPSDIIAGSILGGDIVGHFVPHVVSTCICCVCWNTFVGNSTE
ncbi:hypothetical protein THAOC_13589 [Thalassiosira oceanica]|uniref:Phosphatidic acid phosphatase type 2/haloperoxidase domain-containing protein n=1 Tax=Thalassiosira oceanica TaxID=159749 RepID=K0SKQ4_THAOC|nr:hypothetical protein THAOC_13589 [Thalassiosira oceanica]|eukprot:EJK65534.1 hypothetical protein THAOC_13589 [Thalassiosira oceanica]